MGAEFENTYFCGNLWKTGVNYTGLRDEFFRDFARFLPVKSAAGASKSASECATTR